MSNYWNLIIFFRIHCYWLTVFYRNAMMQAWRKDKSSVHSKSGSSCCGTEATSHLVTSTTKQSICYDMVVLANHCIFWTHDDSMGWSWHKVLFFSTFQPNMVYQWWTIKLVWTNQKHLAMNLTSCEVQHLSFFPVLLKFT